MNIIDAYNKSVDGDMIVLRIEPNYDIEFFVCFKHIYDDYQKTLIHNEKMYNFSEALGLLSSQIVASNYWEIHRETNTEPIEIELQDFVCKNTCNIQNMSQFEISGLYHSKDVPLFYTYTDNYTFKLVATPIKDVEIIK